MQITLPAQTHGTGFFARLRAALSLYRQRQSLLSLDDHLLDDIGLSRPQVVAEAARPIWDAPQVWRQ